MSNRLGVVLLVAAAVLAACGDGGGGGDAADAAPAVDAAPVVLEVQPLSAAHIYFTGADNKREVDAPVDFPAGTWAKVTLELTLACPSNRCDPWDRVGSIGLVEGGGEGATVRELARFVTPYRVGGTWSFDLTDLAPMLQGSRTLRAFIDTWVGPGSQYGDGWLVTTTFRFEAGTPARRAVQVIPLDWQRAVAGDPAKAMASQLPPRTITLPASGFSSSALFTITTGHGQGNADNCAEFCALDHALVVDGTPHARLLWRDDCAQNPVQDQQGTWTYPRAGWCPGADVKPRLDDLGASLAPGSTHTIGYEVETYENTCRPDAPTCTGCTLGTGCAYDGGAHTEPFWLVTSYLVLYE